MAKTTRRRTTSRRRTKTTSKIPAWLWAALAGVAAYMLLVHPH